MRILPTRGLDSARQVLDSLVGKNGLTVLVCDCYSTYKAFAKRFPDLVVLSHCWAHIRRNFVRVGTGHPELKAWAQEWVERVGGLFRLHRQRLQQWDRQQPLERQSGEFAALQQELQARVEELFERAREEGGGAQDRLDFCSTKRARAAAGTVPSWPVWRRKGGPWGPC